MNPAASPTQTFHVWFSTKGRKPALVGEIRDAVLTLFRETALRRSVTLILFEALEDHVHLLLALQPEQSLPAVMHDLKGASAREVFRRYPDLRLDMQTNSFWQKSYGWRRVPSDQIESVKHYIGTQVDRPLRHE
jgi:putative transposase